MKAQPNLVGDPVGLFQAFKAAVYDAQPAPDLIKAAREIFAKVKPGVGNQPGSGPGSDHLDVAFRIAKEATRRAVRADPTLHEVGYKLFLSLLQSYEMPSTLRTKAEAASRHYLRKTNYSGRWTPQEAFDLYDKIVDKAVMNLEVAKQILEKGTVHVEGRTKSARGKFELINTGGFSSSIMADVGEALVKAEALASVSGFERVCYGSVSVSKSLHKLSSATAFYVIASDDLFVRAGTKASPHVIRTILHELGHRYEFKFAKRSRLGMSARTLMDRAGDLFGQAERQSWHEPGVSRLPNVGAEAEMGGKTYRVCGHRVYRGGTKVLLSQVGGDGSCDRNIDIENWLRATSGPYNYETHRGFVTEYAKRGGESENFAEMFAFYCMGDLPEQQTELFEEVVFGAAKTTEKRKEHRFAAKWILEGVPTELTGY